MGQRVSDFRGLEECVLDNNGVVFTEVITGASS